MCVHILAIAVKYLLESIENRILILEMMKHQCDISGLVYLHNIKNHTMRNFLLDVLRKTSKTPTSKG